MLHAFSFAEPLKLNQLRGGESVEEGKCVVHWPQEKAYEERCQKSAHKTLVFLGDQIGSTFPWVALKQPFPTAPLPPVPPLLPVSFLCSPPHLPCSTGENEQFPAPAAQYRLSSSLTAVSAAPLWPVVNP